MPGNSVEVVFRGLCHNCGGDIEEGRLAEGLPCSSCMPAKPRSRSVEDIYRALKSRGSLKAFYWEYINSREFGEFESFFRQATGAGLWSAQRSWAKRLVKGDSFAIIAPTGVGKSTLLTVYALYLVQRRGGRVLYLVPTENLVRQVSERLESIAPGAATAYYSRMPRKAREEAMDKISSGDARLLVVTTGFLSRRFDALHPRYRFDAIIIDDVDSLLRNSRNVERVLLLAGFGNDAVEAAIELVKTRIRLYRMLSASVRNSTISKLEAKIAELEARLRSSLSNTTPGQLVIASATGRPSGFKHLVFRELLGFEVGGGSDYLRNIVDTYMISEDPLEEAGRLVERLGDGVIVFVSQRLGKPAAARLAAIMKERGIPAALALTGARRPVSLFAEGKARVLIGMASRYGVIVRGLDLPERSRYAVFLGAPARRIHLEEALYSPRRMLSLLSYAQERGIEWAGEYYSRLSRLLEKIPDTSIVQLAARGKMEASGPAAEAASIVVEALPRLRDWLVEQARAAGGVLRIGGIVVEAEGPSIVSPDIPTYIQASGRVSRLYKGVMTRGLSVIIETKPEYVEAMAERLRWASSTELRPLDSIDLGRIESEVAESRRGKGKKVRIKTTLLVVESPTKAKTIAWFWGRPGRRRIGRTSVYEVSVGDPDGGSVYILQVVATRGHITDLTVDPLGDRYGVDASGQRYKAYFATLKRCMDCGFQAASSSQSCPRCGSPRLLDSRSVIDVLRKLASEVDEVVIATDPDREGEKIAWDVYLAVKPYNPNIRRGRFHEVTPKAVLEALRRASDVSESLVEAQLARRIVDRWIGFHISNHLKMVFSKPWLGAGRVQTPVLGWIVERHEEWRRGRGYLVVFRLANGGRVYHFTRDRGEAGRLSESKELVVSERRVRVEERNPPPPYTTDSYLFDAANLGLNAALAMSVAQDLFESGLITYHRTDSTRVSSEGISVAREYLSSRGLQSLFAPRFWGEGGAHEAIRPTKPLDASQLEKAVYTGSIRVPIKLTRLHIRVYDMIFRRFIASQMGRAEITTVTLKLSAGGVDILHEGISQASGGYALVNPPRVQEWLSKAAQGARLRVLEARVYRSSSAKLYRSGDLVRLMKEHGIGRPSTYAKAIEHNRRHGYIIESKKAKYLIPTKTGIEVYRYVSSRFSSLVSVETSRRLEAALDSIEKGVESAAALLENLWSSLDRAVQTAAVSGPGGVAQEAVNA